jgi:Lipopolysaccharide-assembly
VRQIEPSGQGLRRTRTCTVLALLVAVAAGGCWYNTTGRSGANVGDIYIPFFQDQTTGARATDLGTRVTERVVDEFERDRSIRVYRADNDRSLAQKELVGTVRRFQESVLTRDPNQTGEEYRVVVTCQITYRDLTNDRVLWQDSNVFGDGNYQLSEGDAGFDRALNESLQEIVDKIVDKTIKAW